MEFERESVINYAISAFERSKKFNEDPMTAEDALIYSLEEHDTGYDLTGHQYEELLKEVSEKC